MNRKSVALLLPWCLYPLSILLIHFTKGERWRAAERAVALREKGTALEREARFAEAAQYYKSAEDAALADDVPLKSRLKIDAARVAILKGEVFEGVEKMERLLASNSGKSLPKALRAEMNATCALGLYYAAYALRLDNYQPALWQREAADARAIFSSLHEEAMRSNSPAETALHSRNLEATIRLQREKLAEIAVKPPPPASLAARDRNIFRKKMERVRKVGA
jgi:hypothetical protein